MKKVQGLYIILEQFVYKLKIFGWVGGKSRQWWTQQKQLPTPHVT